MNQYSETQWLTWIDSLAENGFVVIDNFFDESQFSIIKRFFNAKREEQAFNKAAIGSEGKLTQSEIRGDFTYWLDNEIDTELDFWFEFSDFLIQQLNRYCYLSLKDSEFHLAHYPIGSFYQKHLDQFQNSNNRMITVLYYLNENWEEKDEGYLKMYFENDQTMEISPLGNRLVLFKSAEIPHEVLKTNSGRNSLTGWLLHNKSWF